MKKCWFGLILFIVIISIPISSYSKDKMEVANEALQELELQQYKPLRVQMWSIGYFETTLHINAINETTNKRVFIKVKKSKSLLWEHHSWRLIIINELP